ncbi:hypothetical protein PV11_00367 [Exophiala sideris]|uniref:MmgE/PrpD family protein n=1 Tax=Exophiala sideris TaxID=1016849 RepID=A0A0D1W7E0_9EURO|nr:hypothetical protein PV11_00367 [Exophiala sideris]
MSSPISSDQPKGPTQQLTEWIQSMSFDKVPTAVHTRAKYIILDGLACLLVGSHLPWSTKAVHAFQAFEPPGSGSCNVYGWNYKISPPSAALLNSTFIQGFELDDWHSEAPLHSNALLLPSLMATVEHEAAVGTTIISGKEFLLAAIIGYEVGPRVGLGLWGGHILSAGWHSGAVFGPAAVASAVAKMLELPASQIEDALGIACTQAGGLMSAQFGSEVKRMQHGFAARNGLCATFLARGGYIGIKQVFEQPYGGFLTQFSAGNGKTPNFLPDEISKDLGKEWKIAGVRLKPYASMAGTHPTIDCVRLLQQQYPEAVSSQSLQKIKSITIEMGSDAFHHGGWHPTRPLTSLGAQMCNAYVAASQFIDHNVLIAQFEPAMLDRDAVWGLVEKTTCVQNDNLSKFAQRVTVSYEEGSGIGPISGKVENARGVDPEMSNEDILEKWRQLTTGLIEDRTREEIESMVLNLESCKDIKALTDLMVEIGSTKGAFTP